MMKQPRMSWISVIALGVLTCFFQACTGCDGGMNFTSTAQLASESGGGDGRPIESKPDPGTYYHLVPGQTCATVIPYAGAVEVTASSIRYHAVDPVTCLETITDVSQDQIQWSTLAPDFLGHTTGIYQKLAQPPALSPTLSTPIAESWCRLRDRTVDTDVIVMEDRTTRALSARVLTSSVYGGSWRTLASADLAVSRQGADQKVVYEINGLTMEIDLSSLNADGTSSGRLSGNLSSTIGASGSELVDETVSCRIGSEYDRDLAANPAFSLNFGDPAAPASLSVVRSGVATRFDVNGLVAVASANTPRFDFDPATHAPLGLMIEPASSNLLLQSENLLDPSWVASGLLVTQEGQIAGLSSFKIAANDPTQTQIWGRAAQNIGIVTGQTYSLTFFAAKANQNSARVFVWYGPGSEGDVDFDLTTGQGQIVTQSVITILATSAAPVSGGYRVSVVFTSSVSGTINVGIGPRSVVVGDAIYATGAQLEVAAAPTSYIPTASTGASRGDELAIVSDLSWFDPSHGTMHVAVSQPSNTVTAAQSVLSLAGSGSDGYGISIVPGSLYRASMAVGAASVSWNSQPAMLATPAVQQVALAYQAGDGALALNGVPLDAPSAVPVGLAPTALAFGGSAAAHWSGHLRAFTYWNARLPDNQLADKTK